MFRRAMAMVVAITVIGTACGSSSKKWNSKSAADLTQHEGAAQRVFVVTRTNAFELDMFESSEVSIRGTVLRAWQLPATGPGESYRDEPPDDIVERTKWAALALPEGSLEIAIGDIQYVRVPVREKKDPTAPLQWVMVGMGLLWLALLLLPGIREPEPD